MPHTLHGSCVCVSFCLLIWRLQMATLLLTSDDGSLPLPANATLEERRRFLAQRQLFEMDEYIGAIEELTPRTVFVEIDTP